MRRLGVVAIVVVGLLSVIRAVTMLATNAFAYGMILDDPSSWVQVLGFVLWAVALLAFGFWLIIKRGYVADSLFDEDQAVVVTDPVALLRIALLVIGIMFTIEGSLAIVNAAGQATWRASMERTFGAEIALAPGAEWGGGLSIVLALIQLAVGALFLKSSGPLAQRLWSGAVVEPPTDVTLPTCPACDSPYDPADYCDMATAECVHCGSLLKPSDA